MDTHVSHHTSVLHVLLKNLLSVGVACFVVFMLMCLCRMLHGHGNVEMDTTCGRMANSLKDTDTRVGHVSDTTRLYDRSVSAT